MPREFYDFGSAYFVRSNSADFNGAHAFPFINISNYFIILQIDLFECNLLSLTTIAHYQAKVSSVMINHNNQIILFNNKDTKLIQNVFLKIHNF